MKETNSFGEAPEFMLPPAGVEGGDGGSGTEAATADPARRERGECSPLSSHSVISRLGPLDQVLKEGRGPEVPVMLSSVASLLEHRSGSGGRAHHLCSGSLGMEPGIWVGVCCLLEEAG